MSKERILQDYLNDILEAITDIREFTDGMAFADFVADKKTKAAVIRNIEIIGEAAGKLPKQIHDSYPEIPWKDLCGLRNKMAHEYFGVDLTIVWQTLEDDLAPLASTISEILRDLAKESSTPPSEMGR